MEHSASMSITLLTVTALAELYMLGMYLRFGNFDTGIAS